MSYRLGDDVDDYCIKCKRLTNHSIIAIVESEPATVRCRTCYHEQAWRRGEIPPTKKELKKAALFAAVLQQVPGASETPAETPAAEPEEKKPADPKKS